MIAKIEIVKCCAVVDGRLRHWIMSSSDDNGYKAREIFQDEESFAKFAVVDHVSVGTTDPTAGVFMYVTADMDMLACLRYAVEMSGDDLRL
ncbi:hypothetical protein [Burkholderia ubonensis]|uniref:hypothetical protein n=1 Tax=Burkholderia ubonensis TaxID=101571 RepID=UPI00075E4717|nr:hypothetical protein [Burkholderia ubonensis]KVV07443.1 hypothetical protein WK77_16795 [Burkholderia ubonensis]